MLREVAAELGLSDALAAATRTSIRLRCVWVARGPSGDRWGPQGPEETPDHFWPGLTTP